MTDKTSGESLASSDALSATRFSTASSLLLSAAALYGLGVLVANLYLFGFGAADYSLVRPRAVVTGALMLAPMVIAWGLPLFFFERPRMKDASSHRLKRAIVKYDFVQAWLGTLVYQLIPVAWYVGAVALGPDRTGPVTPGGVLEVVGLGLLLHQTAFITVFAGLMLILSAVRLDDRFLDEIGQTNRDRTRLSLKGHVRVAGSVVFFGVVHIFLFATLVYPTVPRQFGGARPQDVRLVFANASVAAAIAAGIEMDPLLNHPGAAGRSRPVMLIEAGEAYYLIRLPSGQVIEFPSRAVEAVVLG